MKIKGATAYVVVAGALIAVYAFARSGGYRTAQRDISNLTGGLVPAPTPRLGEPQFGTGTSLTRPGTDQPAFGVTNPWMRDGRIVLADGTLAPLPSDYAMTLGWEMGLSNPGGQSVYEPRTFGVSYN